MPGADIRLRVDGNTEFVACDNPHATRLTLHILAAVAEHEAKRSRSGPRRRYRLRRLAVSALASTEPSVWRRPRDRFDVC
jgi:hypothetical protein